MSRSRRLALAFALLLIVLAVPASAAKLGFEADFKGQQSGLDAKLSEVVVTKVTAGSPAARGGLKPGDVIEKFNGMPVVGSSSRQFYKTMSSLKPGQTATLIVARAGKKLSVHLVAAKD